MTLRDDIIQLCGICAASVYAAIQALGGKSHVRVMELKKSMPVPFGESTTKKGIKALLEAGFIERMGETHDSRGFAYRIVK